MKKIVILKHGGGELANQLWNYVSIYAFGLEAKISVRNPSFFEYHSFFQFLPKESRITKLFSLFFKTPRRRSHIINRIGRFGYSLLSKLVSITHSRSIFSSENNRNESVYIPPTLPLPAQFEKCATLYFSGWLFRNPIGLKKYGNELRTAFTPNNDIRNKIENIINPMRSQNKKVIGIHIRQADYGIFKDGKYIIPQSRVRKIIDEYLEINNLNSSAAYFVITSDGPILDDFFRGLEVHISKQNAAVDLFLLSKTDIILGSDSSFGAFAAWYGNIPHIIFKNEKMDWEYYRGKADFFENKYAAMIHY